MKYWFRLSALLFFISASACFPQKSGRGWLKIEESSSKRIWIDTKDLHISDSSEINVWAVESFTAAQEVDSALNGISKIKTLYNFNKAGLRYSISEIIYYDTGNNVIKDFKYVADPPGRESKYNYPLFAGSEIHNIFKKSMEIILNGNKE